MSGFSTMIDVSDDVLMIIFRIYTDPNRLRQPPSKLLAVCKRWAVIAASMPSLWSTISVNIHTRNTIPTIQASKGLENYLQRGESGNVLIPLYGTIQWHSEGSAPHGNAGVIGFKGCVLCRSAGIQLGWLFDTLFRGPDDASGVHTPRALRWKKLSISLSGLIDPPCPDMHHSYQAWATGSLGKPRLFNLPNLKSLSMQHSPDLLPCFNLPDDRVLDIRNCATQQSTSRLSRMICEQSLSMVPSDLLWDICDRIVALDMLATHFEFPAYATFPNLKSITFHRDVTAGTLQSLGQIFHKDRPLETLSLLEMSHSTIAGRLKDAEGLHFATLKTYPPRAEYWSGDVDYEIATLLELESVVAQRGGKLIPQTATRQSREGGRPSLDRRNSWLRKTFKDVRLKVLPK